MHDRVCKANVATLAGDDDLVHWLICTESRQSPAQIMSLLQTSVCEWSIFSWEP